MRKNNISILLIAVLAIFISSCTSMLDLEPNSALNPDGFYKNQDECELALNSVYSDLASEGTYGSLLSILFDAGADESVYSRGNIKWTSALYMHNSSTSNLEVAWMSIYKGVNNVNNFIHQVSGLKINEATKNQMLGEAHFLRAVFYFDLVRLWGAVPLRLTPVKSVESANKVSASKVSEIYASIIKDLEFASANLGSPENVLYGKATNTAANGLLARVYITKASNKLAQEASDYENVVKYASLVENSGSHKLLSSYKQIFLNEIKNIDDNNEVIFEIQFSNLRAQGIREGGRIGNLNGILTQVPVGSMGQPYSYAFLYASLGLTNSYDAKDSRLDWNIADWKVRNDKKLKKITLQTIPEKSKYTWYPGKFRRVDKVEKVDMKGNKTTTWEGLESGDIDKSYTGINFPYLRYADVLLMKAEALNELGKTSEAIPYLNKIRTRAGLSDLDATVLSSKDKFFTELMDERRRELCFEGVRKHDLIRWGRLKANLELDRKALVDAKVKASHYVFRQYSNVEDKHNLMPIPLKELTNNPLMEQNELWK